MNSVPQLHKVVLFSFYNLNKSEILTAFLQKYQVSLNDMRRFKSKECDIFLHIADSGSYSATNGAKT